MNERAIVEVGGMMRCGMASVPTVEETPGHWVALAGTEGQHIPCQHCKAPDSGVKFINGRWIAAWRKT